MDFGSCAALILLGGSLLYLVGHSFIDYFFARKEGMIIKMMQNSKGDV